MPQVRKVSAPVTKRTTTNNPNMLDMPKRRGRPVGSKNTPKEVFDTEAFEPEQLYTYKASDGCTMQSAMKSKTMLISCKHNKPMELQK